MCGITGILSFGKARNLLPDIVRMTDAIRHRGPDDEGFAFFGREGAIEIYGGRDTPESVYAAGLPYSPRKSYKGISPGDAFLAFGHRRLSIVDLSAAGHQPMSYMDRYWLTYNGEVYNHIELRRELERSGHGFQSLSDSEVILAAYSKWGADCLRRFNGMWAFAIYDSKRQEIFLARDRFGVKPLYYWVAPGGYLCFASEIKQFTAFPGWAARVNPQRVYDFLVWGQANHTDETLFSGVYQLPPGHSIRLRVDKSDADPAGRLPIEKWYELKPAFFPGGFADAAEEFVECLKDAVRIRLRADVPVGSCLSGGLDSSSIVCLMKKMLDGQGTGTAQKTFSACAEVERFDERRWIEEVVKATGVEAHYVYPSLDTLFEELPAITWHQDEPFNSTSIYAQWNVFRLASQNGVKVMLDGQGADELLAGYHTFFGARFAGLFRTGQWLRLWREVKETNDLHGHSISGSMAKTAGVLLPPSIRRTLRKYRNNNVTPSWCNIDILGVEACNPVDRLKDYGNSVQSLSYTQMTSTSIRTLLHCEDRDSMAHSVESRVPFLDYRLVEFVLGLKDEFKLSDGVTKRVLREGMSGVIPDRIRDRMDKMGFETPEEDWIKRKSPDLFRSRLRMAVDSSRGILSLESLSVLEDMIAGRTSFNSRIWRMINFGVWMELFSVRSTAQGS